VSDVKKLLVDGFTTKITCPTGDFRVLVYPSGVDVSPRACATCPPACEPADEKHRIHK